MQQPMNFDSILPVFLSEDNFFTAEEKRKGRKTVNITKLLDSH